MLGLPTFLSSGVAVVVALSLGPLLARAAAYFLTGRGLTHLLIEVRGILIPAIATPLLAKSLNLSVTIAIGIAVGISQGVAIARWGTRMGSDWNPSLLGSMALGRSGATWMAQKALRRGAIVATVAVTLVEVILVEALLTIVKFPGLIPHGGLGAHLILGSAASLPFVILAASLAVFIAELLASALLQRRPSKSR